MKTAHKHFRGILHVAALDVEQAMAVAKEIDRMFLQLGAEDPYVTVLSLEERPDAPDEHMCPRCGLHWDSCTCPSDAPAILPPKEEP